MMEHITAATPRLETRRMAAEERRLRQDCEVKLEATRRTVEDLEKQVELLTTERDQALADLETATNEPDITTGPFLRSDLPRYSR